MAGGYSTSILNAIRESIIASKSIAFEKRGGRQCCSSCEALVDPVAYEQLSVSEAVCNSFESGFVSLP